MLSSAVRETVTEIVNDLPAFSMIKEKLVCPSDKISAVLRMLRHEYVSHPLDVRDGVKVVLPSGWFLVRGSNTEPIIRVIAEAPTESAAREIVAVILDKVQACIES
jgi:phosphomannomutase